MGGEAELGQHHAGPELVQHNPSLHRRVDRIPRAHPPVSPVVINNDIDNEWNVKVSACEEGD
jgi:hypothetical protein